MSSTQESGCFSYVLAVAVLSTVLGLLILAGGIAVLSWRFRKNKLKRKITKNNGMVVIGRANRASRAKESDNLCNNNMRPNNNKGNAACPVVIPSIQITPYVPDDQDSNASSRDLVYARIRGAHNKRPINGPRDANCSKPSGDYADLIDSNASRRHQGGTVTPSNTSTPFYGHSVASSQERTYISPVQYHRNKRSQNSGNDSSEVFDNDVRLGMRSRIASVFRSIPSRISSTVSAIGNNLSAGTPTNSPRVTTSQHDAIYLSFQDVSGSNRSVHNLPDNI